METNDLLIQQNVTLVVSEKSKAYLKTAAMWSKFMAILGFVGVGFIVLGVIVLVITGSILEDELDFPFPIALLGIPYLAMAVLVFFPTMYLFLFSQKTAKASTINQTILLEDAFDYLKCYWKFKGILTIILIAFCLFILPVIVIIALLSQ